MSSKNLKEQPPVDGPSQETVMKSKAAAVNEHVALLVYRESIRMDERNGQ